MLGHRHIDMGPGGDKKDGLHLHLQSGLESHCPSSSPLNPGKDGPLCGTWAHYLVHYQSGSRWEVLLDSKVFCAHRLLYSSSFLSEIEFMGLTNADPAFLFSL